MGGRGRGRALGRRTSVSLLAVTAAVLVYGCSVDTSGAATATWEVADPSSIDAGTVELTLAVTRLGCASGQTGIVREPTIIYEPHRVLIRAGVEPLPRGEGFNCQSNDAVDIVVRLDQPVGTRSLVDGACVQGEAASTAMCLGGPVRWPKPT